MNDSINIHACCNEGNIANVNHGEMNQNILRNEYKQQYYIHSAARISNYFSWVKFVVTISSAATAATSSTLFAVKDATSLFYISISISFVCFFVAIITGLLSFLGHVKFEESKALYSYINYRNLESANTVQRVTVDPWYSKYGNASFIAMVSGFILIAAGIFIFWIERFFNAWRWHLTAFVAFAVIVMIYILRKKVKCHLFNADNEDTEIEKIDSRMVQK
ncbi:MAG: hypothetical protein IJY46_07600 [Lentisphaeria bacterium]|nr:hypothetical protein [Lentisphaeria bacterium]